MSEREFYRGRRLPFWKERVLQREETTVLDRERVLQRKKVFVLKGESFIEEGGCRFGLRKRVLRA